MNDNSLNNNDVKYKATGNLNTALENPQINVSSATGVNVQDLGYNNYVTNNETQNNNSIINNATDSIQNTTVTNNTLNNINSNPTQDTTTIQDTQNEYNSNNNTELNYGTENTTENIYGTENSVDSSYTTTNYSYAPTLEEKKMNETNVVSDLLHSKEFKTLIFIVLILCLFLLVMPYLYDFIKGITLLK